jgi:hypothetical protein
MKSENPSPLQAKWICFAAIAALTLGVIFGANAQNNAGNLPAPPRLTQSQDNFEQNGPGVDRPFHDNQDDHGGRPRPPRGGGRGPAGPPPEDGIGPNGPPEEMGPPRGPHDGPAGFGPPQGPGGPPRIEDMNSPQAALTALERSYRTAGHAGGMGKMTGDSIRIFNQAHGVYDLALQAYKVKEYAKAATLADASEHLSRAALELSLSEAPAGPAGWAAPPKTEIKNDDIDQNRVASDLNRVYHELSRPLESKDATVELFLATARQFYKEASTDYAAKRATQAGSRARAADEMVRAAHRLQDASEM